ncbi:MAG: hypothetical protein ULS35scaffold63_18 [Phage 33_17]|nr:MAG: hypothetical protein ULS35scaffold63_18 [Phage 33_17]
MAGTGIGIGQVTTGSFPAGLKPYVDTWFGDFSLDKMQWSPMFEKFKDDQQFVKDVLYSQFTTTNYKPEGSPTSYTSWQQQWDVTYTHNAFSLGFMLTREAKDDVKYELNLVSQGMGFLKDAATRTYETLAASVFLFGFDSDYLGGDGVPLYTASHPTADSNQSNILSTAAALSETSLEDLLIQIGTAQDHMGNYIPIKGQKLIIPPALRFEAERITGSVLRSDTANNDINAMKALGMFPQGTFENQYLSSAPTAYYIITDAKNGLKYFDRTSPELSADKDFDTDGTKYKIYLRCSFGWTDWRSTYASQGVGE